MREALDDHPNCNCGIIGVVAEDGNIVPELFYGLRVLQHRGQESAGIAVFEEQINCKKAMGLVPEVFSSEELSELSGQVGIGHVRYSTEGASALENAQPIVASSIAGDIALAHNGEVVNADELRRELQRKRWAFLTSTDSEVIVRVLANEIIKTRDVNQALKEFTGRLIGSYSLVLLVGERLFAIRDPLAIRPLSYGRKDGMHIVASESVVFDTLGARFIRDLRPGEILELTPHGVKSTRLPHPNNSAHCMFEWVYFSRPDSVLDGRLVYDVRVKIGEEIAREHPVAADMVVPVPDSGRAHAFGFAQALGLPLMEGLIKNRYIERTFIIPDQEERDIGVHLKLNAIRSLLQGKRVVLIDDSIVRGTTMSKIVKLVREAGAKEIHVRIGCPPIRAPCYLGIDMKTRDQFAANGRTVEQIRDSLGADSLEYLTIEGLVRAISMSEEDLCLGCLTAVYPVQVPGERLRPQRRLDLFMERVDSEAETKASQEVRRQL
ncbi:MAG: amidophosphoribosyltransferase [Candidatus Thermoplasmatota archaeon]|nr:amidophosphoribosyltransferase [Candidatus Thermoplasmatota archaeon]